MRGKINSVNANDGKKPLNRVQKNTNANFALGEPISGISGSSRLSELSSLGNGKSYKIGMQENTLKNKINPIFNEFPGNRNYEKPAFVSKIRNVNQINPPVRNYDNNNISNNKDEINALKMVNKN